MKIAAILLAASMLMAGTLGSWANQTETLQVGRNWLTCQIAGGVDISNPGQLQVPSTWSDPNGTLNAIFYSWNYSTQGFSTYQYWTDADAANYFFDSSGDGWYDGLGTRHNVIWNPGAGALIVLNAASQATTITFVGANADPTSYSVPLTGFDLRGSPDPTVNGGVYAVAENIIAAPLTGDAIYDYSTPGSAGTLLYYFDSNQNGWVPRTGTTPPYSPQFTPVYRSVWVQKLTSAVIEGNVYQGATCASFVPLQNWTVRALSTGGTRYFGVTDANGHYAILVPPGTYTVNSYQAPAGWLQQCPSAAYNVTAAAGNFYPNKDFHVKPTVTGIDLAVDVVSYFPYPLRSPCCGQNMTYVITYRNAGTVPVTDAKVKLIYPGVQTFVAGTDISTPSIGLGAGLGTRVWTIPGTLVPGESGNIIFTVTLPGSPCAGPITAQAKIVFPGWNLPNIPANLPIRDKHPGDNVRTLNQQITCSHDPNDLQVTPAGCGPEGFIASGQALTYLIRFQNTGTGPAYQVVVSNLLSADLDMSTLQVIGSSHPHVLEVQGNQLAWTFPNIVLPAQSADDLGSQGYVRYQVSPLGGASAGTVITNGAAIYFDLNAGINTVTTTNTITASPVPVAAFTLTPYVGSTGHTNDFTYTGGNTGATYLWDFGPDATPSTSTTQNPAGVKFASDGDKMVSLQVSLGGCQSDPAVQIVTAGVPTLNSQRLGGQFVLSWQANGYHLQERGDLNPGTSWSATSATVTQVESDFATSLPLDSSEKYYRLSQVAP